MAKELGRSLADYGRGCVGGLLFSLPLLYTMEVWWAGFLAGPGRLLAALGGTFVLLLGYNHVAGMRRDHHFPAIVGEAIEELGLGLLLAALVLWLTGRVNSDMGFQEVLGKVVVEAAVVAIGVSVGKAQLGAGGSRRAHGGGGAEDGDPQGDDEQGGDGDDEQGDDDEPQSFAGQLVMAACGALLIAGNVAPTEEVRVIAAETDPLKILALLALSVAVTAAVLYQADFRGAERSVGRDAGAADMVAGTLIMYGVGLAVSAVLLWFFGRFAGTALAVDVGQTVVLAFPAALGASAGRLLLQE